MSAPIRRARRPGARGRVLLWGAGTLALACGGEKKPPTPVVEGAAAPAASTVAGARAPAAAPSSAGEVAYARCAVCHTPTGEGMPGVYPPLAGSSWVTGPASRPIAVVLHGVQGPITVKGTTYSNAMMPYGTGVPMSDAEVAAVVSYVRSSWGNNAPPVTAGDVARVRKATATRTTPFSVAELEQLR